MAQRRATVDDLYRVPEHGKAELVGGKLVVMEPTGFSPSRASGAIYASLRTYEREHRTGYALPDNAGFLVDLPNRESFSPGAAYFVGETTGMKFIKGAPIFAVEVRSEGGYGCAADQAIAAKRRDYFAAGTQVVWDVDVLGDDVVTAYRVGAHDTGTAFRRGEIADAEPAVPGWRIPIDELFD